MHLGRSIGRHVAINTACFAAVDLAIAISELAEPAAPTVWLRAAITSIVFILTRAVLLRTWPTAKQNDNYSSWTATSRSSRLLQMGCLALFVVPMVSDFMKGPIWQLNHICPGLVFGQLCCVAAFAVLPAKKLEELQRNKLPEVTGATRIALQPNETSYARSAHAS